MVDIDRLPKGFIGGGDFVEGIKYVYEMLKLLTTVAADMVEVRHGYWVDNGERNRDGTLKPFTISCSVCGSSAGHSWMKYCPNCGADMRGEKNAEV